MPQSHPPTQKRPVVCTDSDVRIIPTARRSLAFIHPETNGTDGNLIHCVHVCGNIVVRMVWVARDAYWPIRSLPPKFRGVQKFTVHQTRPCQSRSAEEVGHLRCARDYARDMLHLLHSYLTASFPCQYGPPKNKFRPEQIFLQNRDLPWKNAIMSCVRLQARSSKCRTCSCACAENCRLRKSGQAPAEEQESQGD